MQTRKSIVIAALTLVTLAACKKEKPQTQDTTNDTVIADNSALLFDFSTNVSQATYNDLAAKTTAFYNAVNALNTQPTDANLDKCRDLWKTARAAWEQSEGFLFGPASTERIDPRIDTWPVDYNSLDSVLASSSVYTDDYVNKLDDALKGFHPSEYLIFGKNGNKKAATLTTREKEYLVALSKNLTVLTTQLATEWNPKTADNFHTKFVNAGQAGSPYKTQREAFEELVKGMAEICGEVADGKIKEPLDAKDPSLEESPFSGNSIADFTNNIRSVQNVYLGKYAAQDGKGLEDIVRAANLSLDSKIKTSLSTAIDALGKVTDPFGTAITTQTVQVTNAQKAIYDLQAVLEKELLPFIQSTIK